MKRVTLYHLASSLYCCQHYIKFMLNLHTIVKGFTAHVKAKTTIFFDFFTM
jgi:hypothetical protein